MQNWAIILGASSGIGASCAEALAKKGLNIYGLYLRITSVTEQEIIDLTSKNPNLSKEIARELLLQKQLDIKSSKLIKDLRNEATIEYK